jgi:serine/threonine protein kinase
MLSLLTKLYLLSQCCQALRFLHDRQITHFDIKPLNFLMGKGMYLRITDFG